MTDLMEALFEYINKVALQNYLAVDSDYRISSTRRDTWSLEILDHLDEEGRTLFDRYEKAAFQENSCLLEAMRRAVEEAFPPCAVCAVRRARFRRFVLPDRDVLCRMDPGDGGDAPPSEVRCRLLHGGDCLAEAVFVLE